MAGSIGIKIRSEEAGGRSLDIAVVVTADGRLDGSCIQKVLRRRRPVESKQQLFALLRRGIRVFTARAGDTNVSCLSVVGSGECVQSLYVLSRPT